MFKHIYNKTIEQLKTSYNYTNSKRIKLLLTFYLLLILYLPLHAFFSTWAISNFGNELLIKSWKEIILFFIVLPMMITLWFKSDKNQYIKNSALNIVIFLYAGLIILLALLKGNLLIAELAGVVIDLRFLIMFMLGQTIAKFIAKKELRELIIQFALFSGLIVVVFGAMQVLFLPNDFLRHFGYQNNIIPPYFVIDNNSLQVRILSTLRGPNNLGAYLVFWLPILTIYTLKYFSVNLKIKILFIFIWLASIITLFGSRSRSGVLGTAIALCVLMFIVANNKWRKRLIAVLLTSIITLIVVIGLNWNSSFVQTNIIHRDPNESSEVNSDNQRIEYIKKSITEVFSKPLGSGPGTTNLASTYGDKPVTVENYYLHIAQQYGILGLFLFMVMILTICYKLWSLRRYDVASALLASFIGLAVVNLFLPAWTDETVSLLWWGICGYILVSFIKGKQSSDENSK